MLWIKEEVLSLKPNGNLQVARKLLWHFSLVGRRHSSPRADHLQDEGMLTIEKDLNPFRDELFRKVNVSGKSYVRNKQ